MALSVRVVTPRGVAAVETRVDEVVVRRREERFDPGSEVAILPGHAPMLVETAGCVMRCVCPMVTRRIRLGPGVLEVHADRVTVLCSEAGEV